MSVDYRSIGGRIKQRRRAAGMTQEQLAERLFVTVGYVSQLERGISKTNLDMLSKICTILDCDIWLAAVLCLSLHIMLTTWLHCL